MDLSPHDWERLERYIGRQGSPDDLAELERWIAASAELSALAAAMRTAGKPVDTEATWDSDAAWRKISRRMRWVTRTRTGARAAPRHWVPWAVAAGVLLASGASLLGIRARGEWWHGHDAAPAREVTTRRGERAVFNLGDGSRVVLGAESQLTIPASYNRPGAGRKLRLEGEGYFQVRHDASRPFSVTTPHGVAEDLGTDFVVTTYPEIHGMRVVVASGAVAVRRDSVPLVTLTRGDLGTLDSAGTATVSRVDPAEYLAWTGGALVFDGTPLSEVRPALERWYDLDISLADSSLGARRLTATFKDQSSPQVLDLIALSLDLQVEREGRRVRFRPSSREP
jgi:transmembrane sensor